MNRFAILGIPLILCSVLVPFLGVVPVKADGDSWEILAEMPTARVGLEVAVLDGKIYAIGGRNFDGYLGTNEVYDPATDTWITKAPMPTARVHFGMAVVDGKIYCIGGGTTLNQIYDPVTDSWESKESLSTQRIGLTAEALDGKIYVVGGRIGGPPHYIVSSVTKVYHPSNDTWTTVTPIPIPVFDHASAVVNGEIYVMGGNTKDTVGANLTQVYDPETDTWSQRAEMPVGVDFVDAGVTSGTWAPQRVYVVGGKRNIDPVTLNQIYNPETETWTTGTSMPTRRYGHGVAVVNDTLYAIGGHAGVNYPIYPTNERYTPAGWIPEFPSWLVLMVVLITVTGLMMLYRRKSLKKNSGLEQLNSLDSPSRFWGKKKKG